jgi:ketosteroid isomerase-like protein
MGEAQIGRDFAQALAAKDTGRLIDVLAPDVDFRALTPNRTWQTSTADEFVSDVLPAWFEDTDEIDELHTLETAAVADRERVGYLLRGHNEDGPFVVEQQAYYATDEGRITWLRVLCSGFRLPAD